ncbi:MAG TPA: tRNA (N(6)-L-threonylcarbamoyladenosine(37)-C(2))-methylthiotransferase MtaB [Acidiferrobacteraceae bacterium]|nr:tRNA (N(6)-L-threonylcarbamoyladenosine(37)-C(2))-methylthiotransferase MtaB [Acidiferrobacteraceae bacterium]
MATATIPIMDLVPQKDRAVSRRVAIETMGCKVNFFESELIGEALRGEQWQVMGHQELADVVVINTCTVTAEADRQARQLVRRAVRRNPGARVVVTGCYAQVDPQACARIPGVDLVLGNDRKLELHRLLPLLESGQLAQVMVGDLHEQVTLPEQLVTGLEGHTRAFLQIQQGCDQSCTYCIIHRARGPQRSLAPSLIRRQMDRLLLNGYREIVLCGVDVGAYGTDLNVGRDNSFSLVALLHQLLSTEGDFRIRISSMDPTHIDVELMALMANDHRLCPHLHLSLQSGNTLILKRMKRRYSAETVYRRIEALREAVPELVLGADFMVGFPTETEAAFEDTLEMAQALKICYPHIFSYSNRPGTPAARVSKQVPKLERKRRAACLRQATGLVLKTHLQRRIGQRRRILVEGGGHPPPGYRRGRAADYTSVYVPRQVVTPGEWLWVDYESRHQDGLIARPRA